MLRVLLSGNLCNLRDDSPLLFRFIYILLGRRDETELVANESSSELKIGDEKSVGLEIVKSAKDYVILFKIIFNFIVIAN